MLTSLDSISSRGYGCLSRSCLKILGVIHSTLVDLRATCNEVHIILIFLFPLFFFVHIFFFFTLFFYRFLSISQNFPFLICFLFFFSIFLSFFFFFFFFFYSLYLFFVLFFCADAFFLFIFLLFLHRTKVKD